MVDLPLVKDITQVFTLPTEIVYRILDYLDYLTILISFRNVCQRLDSIIDTYHRYKNCTKLKINWKNINNETLKNITNALQTDTIIDTLCLTGNCIQTEGITYLADLLQKNMKTLEILNLNWNMIESHGILTLSNGLKHNRTLTQLHLAANRIDSQAMKYLADALKTNTTLTKLDLSFNKFDISGIEYLIQIINVQSLIHLDLSGNHIGDEGLELLSNSFAKNNTINVLYLSSNKITKRGIESLSMALRTNLSLKELYFNWNGICDQGTQFIANLLQINTTLIKIDLTGNEINRQGASILINALQMNTTLSKMCIKSNKLDRQTQQDFIFHLPENLLHRIDFE